MNSIGEECTDLKKKYDDCFNTWFSERFLKGDQDDSVCAGIFKIYQECVKNAMKQQSIDFKEIDKDILGTENEYKTPPNANSSWQPKLVCVFKPTACCNILGKFLKIPCSYQDFSDNRLTVKEENECVKTYEVSCVNDEN